MANGLRPRKAGRKKNRKHGRNAVWCANYKATQQRERNKVKKLLKHLARFPSDRCAVHCYNNLPYFLKPETKSFS